MKARTHLIMGGRVQGVFFRAKTRIEAKRHNVVGWIRNLLDGRVEAVLEGEENNVKELVQFCKKGPSGARIMNMNVTWEAYTGEFEDFEIR
jgi:acylphosphatase